MAFSYFQSSIGFSCAGNFAAIVQNWGIDTPGGTGPFNRAKSFVAAFQTPTFGAALADLICGVLSVDSFISSVRCHQVSPSTGNQYAKVFTATDLPGTFSGEVDAAQVAACIIWLTAAEAGLNGRTFLPGVSEDAMENGRFTSAYRSALDDLIDGYGVGVAATVGSFTLYLKNGDPAAFTKIAHASLSLTAGTQRRRLKPV